MKKLKWWKLKQQQLIINQFIQPTVQNNKLNNNNHSEKHNDGLSEQQMFI